MHTKLDIWKYVMVENTNNINTKQTLFFAEINIHKCAIPESPLFHVICVEVRRLLWKEAYMVWSYD